MPITVRCRSCKWEGEEKDLGVIESVEDGRLEVCPSCNDAWNLEDNELQEIREAVINDIFGIGG